VRLSKRGFGNKSGNTTNLRALTRNTKVLIPVIIPDGKVCPVVIGLGSVMRAKIALLSVGAMQSESPLTEAFSKDGSEKGCVVSPILQGRLVPTFVRLYCASHAAVSHRPRAYPAPAVPDSVELPIRGGRQPPPCEARVNK